MKSKNQIDLYQHVSLHVGILKFFGIWLYIPYPIRSIKFWSCVLSRLVSGLLVFVIPTGGQIAYIVKLFISGKAEIQEVAGIMNLVLIELLVSLKLLSLRLRRDHFQRLIDQLNSGQSRYFLNAHFAILKRAVQQSRRMFYCLMFSAAGDVIVHAVIVPALHRFETLPLKMDLIFFDVNDEAYFKYVCAYQILYKPMMIATFISLQSITWATMIHAISQLDILIYNFEIIKELVKLEMAEKNCNENDGFKEVFKRCIVHYRDIKRFVSTLQSTFGDFFSLTLLLFTCILGATALQMLSIESPMKNITVIFWMFIFLLVLVLVLFIDCYFGNTITVKSLHVSSVAFASPWLNLPKELKRNLIIFMAWTQQSLVITAFKLIPISLQTFTKVMNWTYQGFAVMNHMKK